MHYLLKLFKVLKYREHCHNNLDQSIAHQQLLSLDDNNYGRKMQTTEVSQRSSEMRMRHSDYDNYGNEHGMVILLFFISQKDIVNTKTLVLILYGF